MTANQRLAPQSRDLYTTGKPAGVLTLLHSLWSYIPWRYRNVYVIITTTTTTATIIIIIIIINKSIHSTVHQSLDSR